MTTPAPASAPDVRPRVRWWWRPPAFAAGLAAIVAGLYLAGRNIYLDPSVAADRDALAKMRDRHVLLLGTSHGYDLSLPAAGFDGVDLTHGGQDLFEMAYMARTVKQRSRHLDTVIMSLSYFSFFFDNSAYVVDGVQARVGRRIDLYSVFGRFALIPGDSAEYLKGRLYPVVTRDHYQAGFEGLRALLRGGAQAATAKPQPVAPEPERQRPLAWYAAQAEKRCKIFADFSRNMTEHHPTLAEDSFQSTLDLARELRAASIRVVFFTPPYTRLYNDCFNRDYMKQTLESGQRLARMTGAIYYDYSHHPAFIDSINLFEDSDHLNDRGRVQFSRGLKEHLDADSR